MATPKFSTNPFGFFYTKTKEHFLGISSEETKAKLNAEKEAKIQAEYDSLGLEKQRIQLEENVQTTIAAQEAFKTIDQSIINVMHESISHSADLFENYVRELIAQHIDNPNQPEAFYNELINLEKLKELFAKKVGESLEDAVTKGTINSDQVNILKQIAKEQYEKQMQAFAADIMLMYQQALGKNLFEKAGVEGDLAFNNLNPDTQFVSFTIFPTAGLMDALKFIMTNHHLPRYMNVDKEGNISFDVYNPKMFENILDTFLANDKAFDPKTGTGYEIELTIISATSRTVSERHIQQLDFKTDQKARANTALLFAMGWLGKHAVDIPIKMSKEGNPYLPFTLADVQKYINKDTGEIVPYEETSLLERNQYNLIVKLYNNLSPRVVNFKLNDNEHNQSFDRLKTELQDIRAYFTEAKQNKAEQRLLSQDVEKVADVDEPGHIRLMSGPSP